MNNVASLLNGSSSYLPGTRTTIKSRMTLNFGKIQHLSIELAALVCLKINSHHVSLVAIDLILFKLANKEKIHNILDVTSKSQIGTQTTNFFALEYKKYPHLVVMGKMVSRVFLGCSLT